MPILFRFSIIMLALLSSMQGADVNVAKELADIRRAVLAKGGFKEIEKQYLALLERSRVPEEKLAVFTAVFEMFCQRSLEYPDEIIAYASALLALSPEPDMAAKAHSFWAGALLKKNGQTEESRTERAKHEISIVQISLKELGSIRKHEDIPMPSNVSYINALPSSAAEKKKFDDHYAKQQADMKSFSRMNSLLIYLYGAKRHLRSLYAQDEPALRSLVRKQVTSEDEAAKVLAEIFSKDP